MRKLTIAILLITVAACGKKSNDNSSPQPPQNPPPQNPPPALVDDATAQTLLTTYCAPCHSGAHPPLGVLLDTPAHAKKDKTQVTNAVKELTVNDQGQKEDMPPTDDPSTKIPSETERAKLVAWFQQ